MVLKHTVFNMGDRSIKFDLWKLAQSYSVNDETSVNTLSMDNSSSNKNIKIINSYNGSVNQRPQKVGIQHKLHSNFKR